MCCPQFMLPAWYLENSLLQLWLLQLFAHLHDVQRGISILLHSTVGMERAAWHATQHPSTHTFGLTVYNRTSMLCYCSK